MNNILKTIAFVPLYPWFYLRYKRLTPQFPTVLNSVETLKVLIEEKKSLSRFGDGEFGLISGRTIGFQNVNKQLSRELKRILTVPNEKCWIAIPNVFSFFWHFRFDANCFWLYSVLKNWKNWKSYFDGRIYADSLCSRFYVDVKNYNQSLEVFNLWKALWSGRDIVIVEGAKTKLGVGNDLLDNVRSIRRIICPEKDAFNIYYDIFTEVKKENNEALILIALGPTASVLAYDLSLKGFQAIDCGHLDLEYNWMLSGRHKKTVVKGRFVNEVKSDSQEDIYDSVYESQIIKRF